MKNRTVRSSCLASTPQNEPNPYTKCMYIYRNTIYSYVIGDVIMSADSPLRCSNTLFIRVFTKILYKFYFICVYIYICRERDNNNNGTV